MRLLTLTFECFFFVFAVQWYYWQSSKLFSELAFEDFLCLYFRVTRRFKLRMQRELNSRLNFLSHYVPYTVNLGSRLYFIPMHILCCVVENYANQQGHKEGRRQGGHNSPGAESLWGRQITAGCVGKSQQCRKYFLQCSVFASERPQVRTWGRQTCVLPWAPPPPNLVTPLQTS